MFSHDIFGLLSPLTILRLTITIQLVEGESLELQILQLIHLIEGLCFRNAGYYGGGYNTRGGYYPRYPGGTYPGGYYPGGAYPGGAYPGGTVGGGGAINYPGGYNPGGQITYPNGPNWGGGQVTIPNQPQRGPNAPKRAPAQNPAAQIRRIVKIIVNRG